MSRRALVLIVAIVWTAAIGAGLTVRRAYVNAPVEPRSDPEDWPIRGRRPGHGVPPVMVLRDSLDKTRCV